MTYGYDEVDRTTSTSAVQLGTISATYDVLGRRTMLTDSSGTTSFQYDGLSRLSRVEAPQTGAVRYQHNSRNLRTSLTTPDGKQIVYDYRADGQLERMRQVVTPSSTTLATYSYDSTGRLQSVAHSNGATTYTFDAADRLVEQHTTVGGSTVNRFTYTLDRVGLYCSPRQEDHLYDILKGFLTGGADDYGTRGNPETLDGQTTRCPGHGHPTRRYLCG